jgi:hypothetical protein
MQLTTTCNVPGFMGVTIPWYQCRFAIIRQCVELYPVVQLNRLMNDRESALILWDSNTHKIWESRQTLYALSYIASDQ